MLNHKETDKARHYIELLDNARCNAQWQEIPELARKVGKHSPQRQCLTLTARTEQRVAEVSSSRPATSASATGLSQAIPLLQAAIEKENNFPEDAFQAKVCMAWLHRTVGDQGLALSCLPPALDQASERLKQEGGITAKWTYVCIIKGAYIRGTALEHEDKVREAARTYGSILPYISDLSPKIASILEHQLWTQRLLVRYLFLTSRYVMLNRDKPSELFLSSAPLIAPGSLLSAFRAYAIFYEARDPAFDRRFPHETDGGNPHPLAWKAYYDAISVMIQHDIVQPIFKSRSQQCIELKRVEEVFQGLLLKETEFPRADEANYRIELWVDQVIANWRAMCGRSWKDEDLGDGGKASLGRGVLEILYKASTRTFHSTRILRHLFTVHMALADFHLAGKALDTYLEIFNKSKARIEKSGETELGLDDDATALVTAAAGIKMLCAYGRRKEAEKALSIASMTEQWLQKMRPGPPPKTVVSADDVPQDLVEQRTKRPPVPAKALALGYHALGVSQVCWARLTYETSARSNLQAQAISNFHTALDPYIGDEHNIEIQYSLAFALAETRDLDAAIATVKGALSWATEMPRLNGVSATDFANDRIRRDYPVNPDIRELLLKCWHLLALLLSARQSFTTALASCEAALELYGEDLKASGPADTLELYEKKSILEIRMTQLALTEIVDGAEEAVNASGELLNLYTKLFSYSEVHSPKDLAKDLDPPSASTNGTVRSFRGSVLGFPRKTNNVRSRSVDVKTQNAVASSLRSSDSREGSNRPPAISVTDDDAPVLQNPNHHGNFLGRHESNKLRKRNSKRSVGSRRISRATSPTRTGTADSPHHHLHLRLPSRSRQGRPTTADGSAKESEYDEASYDSNGVGVAISHDLPSVPTTPAAVSEPPNPLQGIQSTAQNMNHRNPNTYPVHPKPPPSQNRRRRPTSASLFIPTPIPRFSLPDQQRHTLTLLTKIWLLIAALYRHAGMPVDARGALSEATTHVESVETAIANRDGSSAENFALPGYGGLKSSGELWADVFAEQAALHVSLGNLDQATTTYETALGHYPEHVAATVGLSTILLEAPSTAPVNEPARITEGPKSTPTLGSIPTTLTEDATNPITSSELLSRLAARDRAYGLLSALTKSGTGWDSSEAWYGLATAYEASGQIKKAKEALWWVVKLEEGKGVRTWDCIV